MCWLNHSDLWWKLSSLYDNVQLVIFHIRDYKQKTKLVMRTYTFTSTTHLAWRRIHAVHIDKFNFNEIFEIKLKLIL